MVRLLLATIGGGVGIRFDNPVPPPTSWVRETPGTRTLSSEAKKENTGKHRPALVGCRSSGVMDLVSFHGYFKQVRCEEEAM